jgi:hypothetical protein
MVIMVLNSIKDEIQAVRKWLPEKTAEGVQPHEMGLFIRSDTNETWTRFNFGKKRKLSFHLL